jgi:hypothetical protein
MPGSSAISAYQEGLYISLPSFLCLAEDVLIGQVTWVQILVSTPNTSASSFVKRRKQ